MSNKRIFSVCVVLFCITLVELAIIICLANTPAEVKEVEVKEIKEH